MKTAGRILIIAAVVIVTGLNVNAQNTKSLRVNHNKVHFTGYFSNKVNVVKNLFSDELKSIEAMVRFKPAVIDEQFTSEPMADFTGLRKELESDVKYTPSTIEFLDQENTSKEDFKEILTELETMVKFNASKSFESENMELKQVVQDLEKIVKYSPSAII